MVEAEINNYINKNCYGCCHFKKENMELYKLNLPNGIANNTIDYALSEEDVCRTCRRWRRYQNIIENCLEIKKIDERKVEDEILIFLTVYKIQPYDYVKAFLKISKKSMKLLTTSYGHWFIKEKRGLMYKIIKPYIESEKFSVKSIVRYISIIFKMMYERGKICQVNSYPELKL